MYTLPSERLFFFFFNDTAPTEIYTLSLHDALPISRQPSGAVTRTARPTPPFVGTSSGSSVRTTNSTADRATARSEEHTSELQSQSNLVCRLLLEKKKTKTTSYNTN